GLCARDQHRFDCRKRLAGNARRRRNVFPIRHRLRDLRGRQWQVPFPEGPPMIRANFKLATALGSVLCVAHLLTGCAAVPAGSPVVKSEFLFESAPFPSCHASTIAETKSGLVAAYFGGTAERNPDVGIWVSRHENGQWIAPVEVANGVGFGTNRLPTWNPVLFQPRTG